MELCALCCVKTDLVYAYSPSRVYQCVECDIHGAGTHLPMTPVVGEPRSTAITDSVPHQINLKDYADSTPCCKCGARNTRCYNRRMWVCTACLLHNNMYYDLHVVYGVQCIQVRVRPSMKWYALGDTGRTITSVTVEHQALRIDDMIGYCPMVVKVEQSDTFASEH